MPRPTPTFEESALLRALGARVRELRLAKGLTQEQLVERADLDRSYYADVERGRTNASILILARVAQGLGVSLAVLFEI